jgi:hypothetical protein
MKTYICFTVLFIAFASCNRNNDPALKVSRSEWYLERIYSGGAVHLIIEGSTTADKVTIKTYGDGLVTDKNIELDSQKHFSDDVVISFSVTSVPDDEFVSDTELKIYKNTNIVTVTLTSGKLKY